GLGRGADDGGVDLGAVLGLVVDDEVHLEPAADGDGLRYDGTVAVLADDEAGLRRGAEAAEDVAAPVDADVAEKAVTEHPLGARRRARRAARERDEAQRESQRGLHGSPVMVTGTGFWSWPSTMTWRAVSPSEMP